MKIKPMEEIRALLQSVADGMGVELVDVEFKQGHNPSLTAYIDTEDGVDLDTCEKYHRAIDEALDALDPTFGEPYTLNVSSPGLDRPLKTQRDFDRCLGEKVEVRLFAPLRGKKYLEGVLVGFDGNNVRLEAEKGEISLELSRVAQICRAIGLGD